MAYVVRRLLLYIPVALLVFTIVFWFIRFVPGDFVDSEYEKRYGNIEEEPSDGVRHWAPPL